jgi:hypothetical protein
MRAALKTIASYRNPAVEQDGAQAAARLSFETLESLDLYLEHDARAPSGD